MMVTSSNCLKMKAKKQRRNCEKRSRQPFSALSSRHALKITTTSFLLGGILSSVRSKFVVLWVSWGRMVCYWVFKLVFTTIFNVLSKSAMLKDYHTFAVQKLHQWKRFPESFCCRPIIMDEKNRLITGIKVARILHVFQRKTQLNQQTMEQVECFANEI